MSDIDFILQLPRERARSSLAYQQPCQLKRWRFGKPASYLSGRSGHIYSPGSTWTMYQYSWIHFWDKHQQTSTDMLHEWSIYHFFLVIFGVFLQTLACYEEYGHMLGKWLPQRAEVIFVGGIPQFGTPVLETCAAELRPCGPGRASRSMTWSMCRVRARPRKTEAKAAKDVPVWRISWWTTTVISCYFKIPRPLGGVQATVWMFWGWTCG